MSALSGFTNTLVAFFEELVNTYPEEKDIRLAAEGLKALKKTNPRLILTMFMDVVYPVFREPVLNRDEDKLVQLAHEFLDKQYSEIAYAFWIFDKHWKTMTEANKKHVWDYCTALVVLAEKASH